MTAALDPTVRFLRDVRIERGWSQEKVAQVAGTFTDVTLCRWENGQFQPKAGHLRAWAAALGYTLPDPVPAGVGVAA